MTDPVVKPVKGSPPDWVAGPLNVIGVSIALACTFLFVELLLAVELAHWTGGSKADWLETAQAFGIYWSLFTAGGLIPFCVLAPFLMNSSVRQVLSVICPATVAIVFMLFAVARVEDLSPSLRTGAFVVTTGIAVLSIVLGLLRVAQPGITAIVLALALVGASGTLYLSSMDHLFALERARIATTAALTWFAVCAMGVVVLLLITLRARPRWFVRAVAATIVCGSYPGFLFAQPYAARLAGPSQQQNLLLITVDSLRADACSVYGGAVPTPNIDLLAESGSLFERHYSLSPWTVPSISGLMSSKFPPGLTPYAPASQRTEEAGLYHHLTGYWLDRDGLTFVGQLNLAGYDTVAITANSVLGKQHWLTQGFRNFTTVNEDEAALEPARFRNTPLLRQTIAPFRTEYGEEHAVDSSALVAELGMAYLRSPRSRPFFLWLHFMDPHAPYHPPERFASSPAPWPSFPPETESGEEETFENPTEEVKYGARALYEAEVRYVDDWVGQILFGLRAHGLSDETIVCFTSDHGEALWERGRWGHGHDLHDEQVLVPLIISSADYTPNRIKTPVSAIDVLPTIAELLGREANGAWHGTSLAPLIADETADIGRRPVFAQATRGSHDATEPYQMVVDRNYKLILGLESGSARLYDLGNDPDERTNVADSVPGEFGRLHSLLESWSSRFPSNFNEVSGWTDHDRPVVPNQKLDAELESLGYTR